MPLNVPVIRDSINHVKIDMLAEANSEQEKQFDSLLSKVTSDLKKYATMGLGLSHPVYETTNKLLMDTYAIWRWTGGTQPVAALAIASYLSICEYIVQYNYITKKAGQQVVQKDNPSLLESANKPAQRDKATWRDELWALAILSASTAEGIEFGIGVQLLVEQLFGSAILGGTGAVVAYQFRKTKTYNADSYKLWEGRMQNEGAPELIKTKIGYVSSFLQRIKGIINFNTFVKEAQPNFEAALHSAAVYKAATEIGLPKHVAILLGLCAGSGEYYAQQYDKAVAEKACEELGVNQDYLIEHVWTKAAKFYDMHIGDVLNGRAITDIVGILLPPVILQVGLKVVGNAAMGYTASSEIVAKLPLIMDQVFKQLGLDVSLPTFAPYQSLIAIALAALTGGAGLAQSIARYSTEDSEHGMGPSLEKRYNDASIWGVGSSDMASRAQGYCVSTANYFRSKLPSFWSCENKPAEPDVEKGLETVPLLKNNTGNRCC